MRDEVMAKRYDSFLVFMFCIYFVISIFESYINGAVGAITKYYIVVLSVMFIAGNRTFKKPARLCWAYVLWLIYKILSLLWSEDYTTPKLHFVSQIGMVLFLVVLTTVSFEEDSIKKFINTYFYSSLLLAFLCVFFSKSYHGKFGARQIVVLFGIEQDPNNIAALILIAFSIAFLKVFECKKIYQRVIFLAFTLLCVLGCLKTGSRAALIAMAVVVFFVLFINRKGFAKPIIIGVVLVVAAYFIAKRYLPKEIYERLFIADYGDGSNRAFMWKNVWSAYTKNIVTVLFGMGWGSSTVHTGSVLAAHNTFLTMLCDVGLFGTLVFFVPIIKVCTSLVKKKEYFPIILLISQFVPAFFVDSINKRFFWNAIFILIIYYYKDRKTAKVNE